MELYQNQDQNLGARPLKGFACLRCRQRKVKCDRLQPCSSCTKTQTQCSFIPPAQGRRIRQKRPRVVREGLHAKLRRYEHILEKHGASLATPMEQDTSTSTRENIVQRDASSTPVAEASSCTNDPGSTHRDSVLWSNIGNGLVINEPTETHDVLHDEDNIPSMLEWLQAGSSLNQGTSDMSQFYPGTAVFLKFQRIYEEQIEPMVKMIHRPSVYTHMTAVLDHPGSAAKNTEACLFCFCFATVSAMSQDQCQAILQQDRTLVMRKYRVVASQALTNAQFTQLPDFVNLQAFSFYLFGIRDSYDRSKLHTLSGLAVRLCIRAGLHSDGATLGLPPFETECRRRLWWHLTQLEFHISELLGIRPSMDIFVGNAKLPRNIEDEDISPGMTAPPKERLGLTSLAHFRVRCDIILFLKDLYLSSLSANASGFNIISCTDLPLHEKERMIAELEDKFEVKYLRYFDPSQPLHTFTSIIIRSVLCRMRLLMYNLRYFAEKEMRLTASQREVIFDNASKLLEYAAILRSNPSFHKFIWHMSPAYMWDTILYVLIAARHRQAGPEIERLFHLIGVLISHHSDSFSKAADAIRSALSKWIPEVWHQYAVAARSQGLPEPVAPDYLEEMATASHRSLLRGQGNSTDIPVEVIQSTEATQQEQQLQPQQQQQQKSALAPPPPLTDNYFEFSDLDAFAADPNEWLQWEQLLVAGEDLLYGTSFTHA